MVWFFRHDECPINTKQAGAVAVLDNPGAGVEQVGLLEKLVVILTEMALQRVIGSQTVASLEPDKVHRVVANAAMFHVLVFAPAISVLCHQVDKVEVPVTLVSLKDGTLYLIT